MSDQGKWWKLWCSTLGDDHMENLSIHEWFGWARLGTHIKEHGKDGKIRLSAPGIRLLAVLRVPTFDDAIAMIKRFPNVVIGERRSTVTPETNATVTYEVEYINWFRYQGDFSNDRVRKFRDKKRHAVTAQEEKRRDVEEKRREEMRRDSVSPSGEMPYQLPDPKTNPTACLVVSYKTRKGVAYDNREWDSINFGRCSSASKVLLSLCGDLATAEKCLADIAEGFDAKGMTWTLETIAKHAPDWLKKNGRTDANASRARLRMAIAERRAKGTDTGNLDPSTVGAVSTPVRDSQNSTDRIQKDGEGRGGSEHESIVD